MNCQYHPIYRNCFTCGREMLRSDERVCTASEPLDERTKALREARALIELEAKLAWRGGLVERSDALTDMLSAFDVIFPEGRRE